MHVLFLCVHVWPSLPHYNKQIQFLEGELIISLVPISTATMACEGVVEFPCVTVGKESELSVATSYPCALPEAGPKAHMMAKLGVRGLKVAEAKRAHVSFIQEYNDWKQMMKFRSRCRRADNLVNFSSGNESKNPMENPQEGNKNTPPALGSIPQRREIVANFSSNEPVKKSTENLVTYRDVLSSSHEGKFADLNGSSNSEEMWFRKFSLRSQFDDTDQTTFEASLEIVEPPEHDILQTVIPKQAHIYQLTRGTSKTEKACSRGEQGSDGHYVVESTFTKGPRSLLDDTDQTTFETSMELEYSQVENHRQKVSTIGPTYPSPVGSFENYSVKTCPHGSKQSSCDKVKRSIFNSVDVLYQIDMSQPTNLTSPKKTKPMWKAAMDPRTGRQYFYHRKTGQATWIKPIEEFTPLTLPTPTEDICADLALVEERLLAQAARASATVEVVWDGETVFGDSQSRPIEKRQRPRWIKI